MIFVVKVYIRSLKLIIMYDRNALIMIIEKSFLYRTFIMDKRRCLLSAMNATDDNANVFIVRNNPYMRFIFKNSI